MNSWPPWASARLKDADMVYMHVSALPRTDRWLSRFGSDVPMFARVLLEAVRTAQHDPTRLTDVRAGASALGVLRAQQGHAVAGVVEDLLALRESTDSATPYEHRVIDLTLALAVSAYVAELTAVLASRATRDPLTGLPNRAAFDEALAHEIAASSRGPAPSLLLIDLDRFKLVNDTDGHLAGDAVLVAVADVLRANVRPSDVACRLGGDEFAVVLPRTGPPRAQQVANRVLAAARKAQGLGSENARVSLSIGVGWLPTPSTNAELVELADVALYAVKAGGGDGAKANRA
jgi:diguanylate cyclase (GGDEF)-like protein